ncbi:MAG TPA: hypothetical protein VK272_11060 [Solirubrobacteraceae bacterium]|nr:hypothetical protein [Solirubrobacteraceae bacterium]
MDPIHPITPGPTPISARLPVQPLERITRERDRPWREEQRRRRREAPSATELASSPEGERDDDDGGERPHVDVRV